MNDLSLGMILCDELLKEETNSSTIIEMLNLVKEKYNLIAGMIYEVDQFNVFHLKEHNDASHPFCPQYNANDIRMLFNKTHEETTLCMFQDHEVVKQLFHCSSMLLYPIRDHIMHVLGFIAFSADSLPILSFDEIKSIQKEFMLLSKFVKDRMYENKVSFAIKSLEGILDNTGIDIYVNDFNNHDILYVNKSMAAPYGGVKEFMNRKCWEVLFPGQHGQCEFCPQQYLIDEHGDPTKVYTWDYQRAFDGSWFRVFSSAFHWIDGRMAHVVSSADITDNKKYEELIHHMANYDELTNLPNRRMLIKECKNRIQKATLTEQGYILFFDIDGFKKINDTLGHSSGDEFLILLGKFFSEIPLLKDSIYRNGGDEFVAVIGGENISKDNIRNLSNAILLRFQKPWQLTKGDVYCSTSIGIACYPEDGNDPEELIHIADQAMYQAKKSGGARMCFGFELKK